MISNPRHGLPPRLMAHQPTRFATAQESKPSPSSGIRITFVAALSGGFEDRPCQRAAQAEASSPRPHIERFHLAGARLSARAQSHTPARFAINGASEEEGT